MAGSAIVFPTTVRVTSVAHGFVAGNILRRAAGSWALAQADSVANADVAGVVSYAEANIFTLVTDGPITLAGLTDGAQYFLSPSSPGAYTATDPASAPVVGQVSVPVFWALSTTQGFVRPLRGMEISTTTGTVVARSGSAIAFDIPAIYNTPDAPTDTAMTFDLTGANANTEVWGFFDNSTEPTWPAYVYPTGAWNNSALNVVRFLYIDDDNVSATINSNTSAAPTGMPYKRVLSITNPSTSGTTAIALTGMNFTLPAGVKYEVEINLRILSPAAGLKLGWWSTVGTDQTFFIQGGNSGASNAFIYGNLQHATGLNALGTTAFSAVSSTNNFLWLKGYMKGGAADSVMDLRFASNTNTQTSQVYTDGSFVTIWP